MSKINIFLIDPPVLSKFFKFSDIGDEVQGTYIGRSDSIDNYGKDQAVAYLLQENESVVAVAVNKTKKAVIEKLEKCTPGQVIGFRFVALGKEQPGKRRSKIIYLSSDKGVVDSEWLSNRQS